jgi:hypothetical protein
MATEALQIDALWSGLNNPTNGKSYGGAIVATFATDGSTPKAVWEDKAKTLPSALGKSQFTLDSNGQAEVFGDGTYVLKVYAPSDTGLLNPLMTFDDLTYTVPLSVDEFEYDHNTDGSHIVYESIADLRASTLTPFDGQKVSLTGYYSDADGAAGDFVWDASSTDTDNNGTIIKVTAITTGRWVRIIPQGPINIKWFGALDGSDSTTAIQECIDYARVLGYDIFVPSGTYEISATLELIINALERTSNIYGEGQTSVLDWVGANNGTIYNIFAGVSLRGVQSQASIKNLYFTNSGGATGVTGIKIGTAVDFFGVGNMTISENSFLELDTCIYVHYESDELTIERNFMNTYTTYGVYSDRNNGVRILNNHMQTGGASSHGIYMNGGQTISVNGNVIQNATGANGVYFNDVNGFTFMGNYGETSIGASYYARFHTSAGGIVAGNHIGGFPGADLYSVNGDSHGIQFGPNDHTESGGVVNSLITVTDTSEDVSVTGLQNTSGSVDTLSGNFSIKVFEERTIVPRIATVQGETTIPGLGTITLFAAEDPSCYLVYAKQNTEFYSSGAWAHTNNGATTITDVFETNANLSINATGTNVELYNGQGATRGIKWSAIRIY